MNERNIKSQAELLDVYLDALAQNPNTPAPDGLDEKMAAFARRLLQSETHETPELTAQDRIWQKMMAAAAKPTPSAPSAFSPNGHAPSSAPMSIPDLPMEELMNHSISLVEGHEIAPRRLQLNFSMVAAAIVVVLFVGLLLYAGSQLRPDDSFGAVGLQGTNTQLPAELTSTAIIGNATATAGAILNPANATPAPNMGNSSIFTLPPYQSALIPLEVGESLEGTVTADEPTYFYLIQAQAGDLLSIRVDASDIVSMGYSLLYAPQVGSANNNSGGGGGGGGGGGPAGQPISQSMTIPVSVDSAIVFDVQNETGGQSVTYTINLEKVEVPVLDYGETASGVYGYENPSHPYIFYDFEGKRGDIVDIRVESEMMDMFLALIRLNDSQELVTDDDGGVAYNPEILGFQLPADGTYRINLSQHFGVVDGILLEYEISISKRLPSFLGLGEPVSLFLTDKFVAHVLEFEGVAGETVELVIGYDTVDTTIINFSIEQNGQKLDQVLLYPTAQTREPHQQIIRQIVIPESGTVTIFVNADTQGMDNPTGPPSFWTNFSVQLNR